MSEPKVIHPEGWLTPAGYAHGVSATGRVIVTAGQFGWNPATGEFESDDMAAQAAQALRNVVAVLRAAGVGPEHLVRLTWFVTDRFEFARARRAIATHYRELIGERGAATSVIPVIALVEERAKVQIEATAVGPA